MKGEIKVVTGNSYKFMEFQDLAKDKVILSKVDAPKLEIQADSLEEIVRYSAVTFYSLYRSPLIVEDSGLFVEALRGFPGPYTNYVKRTLDCEGILKLMEGLSDRKAYFRSVIAYIDGERLALFKGEVSGRIAETMRGDKGFGFDPIFIPDGYGVSFGEMELGEKNSISHRGRAFREFLKFYESIEQ
ncbi:dITP/XTP pyrophosphatase [Metallosphaera sp. J1]|uniref:XTP/dITP diphosphatase n=1 Tax=Metallosphaera javensis (ex Hofmann et al. 2022) TaxID=99938 RepID=UPI001EE0F2D4|nr:XTP/dITP diphosphatase [Metallosphaera javensis (ex Hofmann et al. 2022)]MCG3107934.1 dITP/XTP pyrophosphatase [Metallosphaera javensis (ex Hofmann et al. 2022)]